MREISRGEQVEQLMRLRVEEVNEARQELLIQVQKVVQIILVDEAKRRDIYDCKYKLKFLVPPPGRVKMWLQANKETVVCDAVEVSRGASGKFENPLDWSRR